MIENQTSRVVRVCFVCPKAYPLFNEAVEGVFGGAEVDLYLLATEIAKDDYFQVSFVVADYGQENIETRENVTIIKSLDIKKNLFLGSPRIWKALKKANADIYMQEACSLGTVLIAFFCKCKNKKFVYRTASTRECDGTYTRQHYFRGKAVNWAFSNSDKLIIQNEEDLAILKKITGLPSTVIGNATRLSELTQKNRNTILWVGRSAPVKRPDLFLELARQVPDEHFTMICPRASGDNNYEKLVAEANGIQNLDFITSVPFHKIDNYFQQAGIFVNTSDSEGFPNTFVQACKSATPILSLNVNPDKFLDSNKCGVCANGNWEKFANSLKSLLDEKVMEELGGNGRKYAEQKHNIKKIIQYYKDIFTELMWQA